MAAPITVSVKRRIKTIADRVFGTLTDPQRARNFMFATEHGKMTHVEIEPKVGGKYIFVDERDGEEVHHVGEITKIERPRLLEFKLTVEKYSEHSSLVKIQIEDLGLWCEVTIIHEMHEDFGEDKPQMEAGWNDILEKLASIIEN